MVELTVEQRLDKLEDEAFILFKHLLNSYLYYCRKLKCQYCGHDTLQAGIRLQGENEDAFQCLNCGKIWHKEQKLVEYQGKI